ncbi:sigma factor G inhibitor Gin [Bacillus salacetis]|uniref:Sigma factor G inhibitor Gin n=1 Tax=Bacillus salacetis TaxID=2315464 RepID=A0A3A1QS89_9BACI|nr:sigma factor G inhibitor Gin [Bacillus salacetis]RIW29892.1 sigma factor G inhibitor Gin [Bacillus salacetis]
MEVGRLVLNTEKTVRETCIVCSQEKATGIHLYTSFVCIDCEKDMVCTETNNPQYKYFVERLKKVNTPQIFS